MVRVERADPVNVGIEETSFLRRSLPADHATRQYGNRKKRFQVGAMEISAVGADLLSHTFCT
jgi:hypothetical protein